MKLPIVSRKKYETEKNNMKLINDERFRLSQENRKMQIEIKELKEEIRDLKTNEVKVQTRKCEKCDAAFNVTAPNRKYCDKHARLKKGEE